MPTSLFRRLSLLALLVLPFVALPAFGAQANRIATVNSAVTVTLSGSAHPMARPEFDKGSVADDMRLSGMALNFQRSAAQQAALETLIQKQNDPNSTSFHQWLTPEAFAAQFGMSAQDIAKAAAWLKSQGFSVIKVADSGNAILFSGTAGQVRSALGTEIHHYQVGGVTHFANAGAISLPAALASVVTGVSGLDDFKPTPKSVRAKSHATTASAGDPVALFTSGISGNHYLTPGDLSTIYDVTPLANAAYTGAGVTIGVAGQTDIVLSDVTSFRAAAGLTVNNPTLLLIPGSSDPGISLNDLGEADLDLEWSGGLAPGANVVFLNSTNAFASVIYGIQNRVTVNSSSVLIPILSISYGDCEAALNSTTISTMEAAFQQAAAQGQTVIAAAGDSGAADCDGGDVSTLGLAVDYPASSAYVTGIGGTEFNEGTATGPTTYWNGSSTLGSTTFDVISSAKSYIPEMAWNDTPNLITAEEDDGLLGGGGGKSSLFAKPTWQTGVTGIPADGQRDVPDISLSASPVHDAYLVCTQVQLESTGAYAGSCGSGFRISDGAYGDTNGLTAYGGTSLGAPSFAGMLALIEQKMGSEPQGLLNKALYSMASNSTTYASAFHDITVGNNQMPCSSGNGCLNGVVGYVAATGYDQATGLGSIDLNNLATAYAAYVVSNGGKAGTVVTMSYAPVPPVIGQTVTLTATVAQSPGSGIPTGTVTFSVDGTVIGSAVGLTAGTAATTYSFSTGGPHIVVGAYSGDSADYASISQNLTVTNFSNAAGAVATTTVLSSSKSSTSLYASSGVPTFTAAVSTSPATGTISGTVTFTVGTGASAVSTIAAIVPGSVGTGTATFTPASVIAANGFTSPTTSVSAHYNGTTSFQQSTSSAYSLTVSNPSFTLSAPNLTIASTGIQSGTETITLGASGGFADPVSLTLASSSFSAVDGCWSPTTAVAVVPGTAIFTLGNCNIVELKPLLKNRNGIEACGFGTAGSRVAGIAAALLCVALCFRRKRGLPRLAAVLAIVLLGGLMAGITGCGNGSSSTGSSITLPAGTYPVTVTGTDTYNPLQPAVTTTFTITIP